MQKSDQTVINLLERARKVLIKIGMNGYDAKTNEPRIDWGRQIQVAKMIQKEEHFHYLEISDKTIPSDAPVDVDIKTSPENFCPVCGCIYDDES